jgi:hypothetical protein
MRGAFMIKSPFDENDQVEGDFVSEYPSAEKAQAQL